MNATDKLNPDVQHYKDCKIQPIDYIVANNMSFLEGNIIKYVSRYKSKGGVEDLKKAKNYLEWLINSIENCELRIENEKIPWRWSEEKLEKIRKYFKKNPVHQTEAK